jgi:hypothetical protein
VIAIFSEANAVVLDVVTDAVLLPRHHRAGVFFVDKTALLVVVGITAKATDSLQRAMEQSSSVSLPQEVFISRVNFVAVQIVSTGCEPVLPMTNGGSASPKSFTNTMSGGFT